jgi:hypothetical protein
LVITDVLSSVIQTWASLYANHAALRTALEFLHVGGLVAGGGCAIAADRITLVAKREPDPTRRFRLETLHGTHRVVLYALAAVIASGVLMFASDVDTFLYSKVFWLKMVLMMLLLANGSLIVRAERRIESGDSMAWPPLVAFAIGSVVLWSLTTLAGAALPNLG